MIDTEKTKELSRRIESEMPWLKGINSHDEYQSLMILFEQLIEEPSENEILINLMHPLLHSYEENAEEFKDFNARIALIKPDQAMLGVILDQNSLNASDLLVEVGPKELVDDILSGKDSLTAASISALSKRFSIPEDMFM